jgi:hypothetical protein
MDSYSRKPVYIGMHMITSKEYLRFLTDFAVNHRPSSAIMLDDTEGIHADAGSQLLSEEQNAWGASLNSPIKTIWVAPNHQEQNVKPESSWQHICSLTFRMLTHA